MQTQRLSANSIQFFNCGRAHELMSCHIKLKMYLEMKIKNTKFLVETAALLTILFMFLNVACVSETNETIASQQPNLDVEQRLKELGVELRKPSPPTANFVRAVRTGNLVFLAGHGPGKPEGGLVTGKVGADLNLDQAIEAARLSAVSLLSSLKAEIGDLNKVKRIVKVHGMVNAVPDFTRHSQVMNGCSDFLVAVFGQRGKHARAAVGMGSLPRNMAIEIEMIVEVE